MTQALSIRRVQGFVYKPQVIQDVLVEEWTEAQIAAADRASGA